MSDRHLFIVLPILFAMYLVILYLSLHAQGAA